MSLLLHPNGLNEFVEVIVVNNILLPFADVARISFIVPVFMYGLQDTIHPLGKGGPSELNNDIVTQHMEESHQHLLNGSPLCLT